MKINVLLLSLILFVSCGRKEESKLEAFNAEAFAFQIDGGWEVNATVRIKGFHQTVANESYTGKLSYSVGIITPANDTVKNIISDQLNETQNEEIIDLPVEVQLELDSSYTAGKYQLIFDIKDELSGNNVRTVKDLELE